jgi:hypothetical protein
MREEHHLLTGHEIEFGGGHERSVLTRGVGGENDVGRPRPPAARRITWMVIFAAAWSSLLIGAVRLIP